MIGEEGGGFSEVMRGFDYARSLISMICIGSAQAAIDEALEYCRERRAFGKPIGRFQGLIFPLIEFQVQLRAARLLALEALWLREINAPHTEEANMVKSWVPRLAFEAIHQCILTFGHFGVSEDMLLTRRLQHVVGLEIADGTAQIAKLVVARGILGREFAP